MLLLDLVAGCPGVFTLGKFPELNIVKCVLFSKYGILSKKTFKKKKVTGKCIIYEKGKIYFGHI